MRRLLRWLRVQMTGGSGRPTRSHANAIDVYMEMRSEDIERLSKQVAYFEERLGIEQQIDEHRHDGGS